MPRNQDANKQGNIPGAGAGVTPGVTPGVAIKAAAIVVLTLLAYSPAMRAGFVFDDTGLITDNPLIHADDGLYRFWFSTDQPDYFPLTSTSLWLEWRLWSSLDNPAAGYHITNIALHACNAMLIWLILMRMRIPGAWFAALIFAVHPVNVSSVAWIAERKNTLSMLWLLMSLLWYLKHDDDGGRRWYFMSLGAFLLALLSKTSVVMLPIVLLLLICYRHGRLGWPEVRRSVPYLAMSLVLGLVTVFFQYQSIEGLDTRPEGLLSQVAATGWCVWFYLFCDLLPLRLATIYPRWSVDPTSWPAWLPLLGILIVALAAWRYRATWGRPMILAGGIFLLMLLPALGLIKMTYHQFSLVADHFQYAAMIAPVALLAAVSVTAARRAEASGRSMAIAAAVLLTCLSLMTWHRAAAYKDSRAFWTRAIAENQDAWIAYSNLGTVEQAQGRHDQAIKLYLRALEIKADYADARHNLANVHNDLAMALAAQGQLRDAAQRYGQALAADANFIEARIGLGQLYYRAEMFDQAIEHYAHAVRLAPEHPEARYHLGVALTRAGRSDEALAAFRAAGDPAVAVKYALRAAERSKYRVKHILDTLAMAYEAAGQDQAAGRIRRRMAQPALSPR